MSGNAQSCWRELVHRMPSSSSMALLAAPDVGGWWVRSSLGVRPLGADVAGWQTGPISDHTLCSRAHFAGVASALCSARCLSGALACQPLVPCRWHRSPWPLAGVLRAPKWHADRMTAQQGIACPSCGLDLQSVIA